MLGDLSLEYGSAGAKLQEAGPNCLLEDLAIIRIKVLLGFCVGGGVAAFSADRTRKWSALAYLETAWGRGQVCWTQVPWSVCALCTCQRVQCTALPSVLTCRSVHRTNFLPPPPESAVNHHRQTRLPPPALTVSSVPTFSARGGSGAAVCGDSHPGRPGHIGPIRTCGNKCVNYCYYYYLQRQHKNCQKCQKPHQNG